MKNKMSPNERVLIRDTDHLAHFAKDVSASLDNKTFADVVLRCANNATSKKSGPYPSIRVHRAILAAMSERRIERLVNPGKS